MKDKIIFMFRQLFCSMFQDENEKKWKFNICLLFDVFVLSLRCEFKFRYLRSNTSIKSLIHNALII